MAEIERREADLSERVADVNQDRADWNERHEQLQERESAIEKRHRELDQRQAQLYRDIETFTVGQGPHRRSHRGDRATRVEGGRMGSRDCRRRAPSWNIKPMRIRERAGALEIERAELRKELAERQRARGGARCGGAAARLSAAGDRHGARAFRAAGRDRREDAADAGRGPQVCRTAALPRRGRGATRAGEVRAGRPASRRGRISGGNWRSSSCANGVLQRHSSNWRRPSCSREQQLDQREAEIDAREAALHQLQEELRGSQREMLEMRLATEEIWAQLSGALAPASLTRSISQVRAKLADHYRQTIDELAQRSEQFELVRRDLAQQLDALEQQREELQAWAERRQADIEEQAARLVAREQELDRQQQHYEQMESRWHMERADYQAEIRQLLASIRDLELEEVRAA